MSKKQKLKELRKEIRTRFQSSFQKALVAEEIRRTMQESNRRTIKRLYFTGLDPLLFDQANK